MTRFVPSLSFSRWSYSSEPVAQPKAWTELQAGVECLTQLVLLIESMLSSDDPSVVETAELLQVQIVYNGEVLDISFDILKASALSRYILILSSTVSNHFRFRWASSR